MPNDTERLDKLEAWLLSSKYWPFITIDVEPDRQSVIEISATDGFCRVATSISRRTIREAIDAALFKDES